jgi:hypothetical protein
MLSERIHHCLPILQIYPGERFVAPWNLLCGTPVLAFLVPADSIFLLILFLITSLMSLPCSITTQKVNKFTGRTKYTSSNASPRVGLFTSCVYPLSHTNLFIDSSPPVVHSTFPLQSDEGKFKFLANNATLCKICYTIGSCCQSFHNTHILIRSSADAYNFPCSSTVFGLHLNCYHFEILIHQ